MMRKRLTRDELSFFTSRPMPKARQVQSYFASKEGRGQAITGKKKYYLPSKRQELTGDEHKDAVGIFCDT